MKFNVDTVKNALLGLKGLDVQAIFKQGNQNDVLGRVNAGLLLYAGTLINLANGKTIALDYQEEESFTLTLAQAASSLLRGIESPRVMLFLPNSDFVATQFEMVVSGEKMLRSALELQSHSLIPAYEDNLLLAVNTKSPKGTALWFSEQQANALFRAFDDKDIFLGALLPRSLAAVNVHDMESTQLIKDETEQEITIVQLKQGNISAFLNANKTDLTQEIFTNQWEKEIHNLGGEITQQMAGLEDWQNLSWQKEAANDYLFYPKGSLEEGRRIAMARNGKIGAVVIASVLVILLLPFISSWIRLLSLESELDHFREISTSARGIQASIYDMEQEWGAITNYPDQQVADVLVSLNQIMEGALTSFSINEGVIDISGFAQDPAYLVELLTEKEEFYNVAQSRAARGGNSSTLGNQFGIRMNFSGVDFEQYEEDFPVIND